MSNMGFKNPIQDSLMVTYNDLSSYINTLCAAINKPPQDYADKGVKCAAGSYQQLSNTLLQTENEFYGVVRPKRSAQKGETGLSALASRGVEYIEIRCVDINPYEPLGINQAQIKFLDLFLLYCLLIESPAIGSEEYLSIQHNQQRVAYRGRDPQLSLLNQGKEQAMGPWDEQLFAGLGELAQVLDAASQSDGYSQSVALEKDKLNNPCLSPSAKMLNSMASKGLGFTEFAHELSLQHKAYFCQQTLKSQQQYQQMVRYSIEQQQAERKNEVSFEVYLQEYFSQYQQLTESYC